jgi:hypothetical protein
MVRICQWTVPASVDLCRLWKIFIASELILSCEWKTGDKKKSKAREDEDDKMKRIRK